MSTAILTWTPPTTRTDGSPLPPDQIAGAHVFDGSTEIGSVPGATGTFATGQLEPGDHSFTVVTRDVEGHNSDPSNAASVTVPQPELAAPAAITDLAATLG